MSKAVPSKAVRLAHWDADSISFPYNAQAWQMVFGPGLTYSAGCADVEAKRVPGNFHVQFTHESFNFENALINATHAINHLSFGTPQPKATRNWIE